MSKQKVLYLIITLLFGINSESRSQIVASTTAGCAPLTVNFSGPPGATNIFWNLGPTQGTANIASASGIFPTGTHVITYTALVGGSPVSYSIQVVSAPPPTGSFSYIVPSSHCVPMTASFIAASSNSNVTFQWGFGDLSPIGYGSPITHQYVFSGNFIPIVLLTDAVTGCTAVANASSGGTLHVSDPPNLVITSSNGTLGCVPPFTTNINGSTSTSGSPMGGGLTYIWQFVTGNPGASSAANPGGVAFPQGSHTVMLTATDNNQCTGTASIYISVINPSLSVVLPPTVCVNAPFPGTINCTQGLVNYTVPSVPIVTFQPLIPNTPNIIDTIAIIPVPGTQSLFFQVPPFSVCPSFTLVKTVFVEQVVANFTCVPPGSSCGPTMVTTYSNTSTINSQSPLTFTWMAAWPPNAQLQGVPTTTAINSMASPSFTFSQGSNNPYTIYKFWIPYITLVAMSTSPAQCTASVVYDYYDTLMRPTAWFTMDKKEGCGPLTVRFKDSSMFLSTYTVPVTNYTWSNGATPPTIITGTDQLQFTYLNTGTYTPSFTIQTINGCFDTFSETIIVSIQPTVTATYPASVCAGAPVTISLTGGSTSSPPGSITHWHVTTDDKFFSGCITNSSPTYSFSHPGTHSVLVTVAENGCAATFTMPATIDVSGPIGRFRYRTTCTGNKKLVDFSVFLNDASSAILNFGDGNQQIITGAVNSTASANFTHLYTNNINYTVTLTTSKAGGNCAPNISTQVIKIRDPKARITYNNQPIPPLPQAMACTKSKFLFSGLTSSNNVTSCSQGYKWTYTTPNYEMAPMNCPHGIFYGHNHGSQFYMADPVARDTFRVAGIYTISLEVIDENGCTDVTTVPFRIGSAVPDFTFAANPHCYSDGPLQIVNNTQNSQIPPDLMNGYLWHWGDGSTLSATNPYDNPTHQYPLVTPPFQTFEVMCIGTNTLNCIDTTIHMVQINNPVTGFYTNNLYPCVPLGNLSNQVNFYANAGYPTYSLSYGTPTQNPTWQTLTTMTNVSTKYALPGVYNPTLTIVDAAGCKATDVMTITALGQPTANIKFLTPQNFCWPAPTILRDTSKINVTPVTGFAWSVNNITTPALTTNSMSYIAPAPGTYTIKLTSFVGPLNSCPSTASAVIHAFDTKAIMTLDKTTFCLGETLKATVSGKQDVGQWQWFFGNLVPQPLIYNVPFATNPVNYKYDVYPSALSNGKAVVTLKVMSDQEEGCVRTYTANIQVIKIDGDFRHALNTYSHCLNYVPDEFVSTTPNPLGLNFEYSWTFGDLGTGTGIITSHTYEKPGVFPVQMSIKDAAYSCTSTAIKNMTILPLPVSSISISDTLVCPDQTFSLTLQGKPVIPGLLTGYLSPFNPGTFAMPLSNTLMLTSTATVTTKFIFNVVDTNLCKSPDAFVFVNVPEPAPEVHTATTVIIGSTIQLNAPGKGNYSYEWTPQTLYLSDSTISNPVSTSTADITYSVFIRDEPNHCWLTQSTFSIIVLPLCSVDVPTAFTPNGDGINDFIFPDGWGIRRLLYFRVYNRWGQLLFETNEFKKGWDGTFQGIPQNMETYVYQTEVEGYIEADPTVKKSGSFKLIR